MLWFLIMYAKNGGVEARVHEPWNLKTMKWQPDPSRSPYEGE